MVTNESGFTPSSRYARASRLVRSSSSRRERVSAPHVTAGRSGSAFASLSSTPPSGVSLLITRRADAPCPRGREGRWRSPRMEPGRRSRRGSTACGEPWLRHDTRSRGHHRKELELDLPREDVAPHHPVSHERVERIREGRRSILLEE